MARARLLSVLVLLLIGLAGCIAPMPGATAPAGQMEMAAPAPVPGQITVSNVRARPAPLEGGNGAAFMVVLNGTEMPVRLISAASDVAAAVELHETFNEEGVMKMVPQPEGFEVPAGGSVELKPGGKHVMLIGLAAPLAAGQAFSLTLNFDDGSALDLSVPVVEMTGMPMGEGAMPEGEMGEGAMQGESMAPEGEATPTSQP